MSFRGLTGAIAALMLLMPTLSDAADITVDVRTEGLTSDQVRAALAAFEEACQPLMTRYAADITSVEAVAQDEYADYRRAVGWRNSVEVAIKIAERPNLIPQDLRANGHTLWYYLGAGNKSGFFAKKAQSQALCGLSVSKDGSDVFEPVPGLDVLLTPEVAVGTAEAALSAAPFNVMWEPPSMAGEQRTVTGSTPSNMQVVRITGPEDSPTAIAAMVDWRPESRILSRQLLAAAVQAMVSPQVVNGVLAKLNEALSELSVGTELQIIESDAIVSIARPSDVMFRVNIRQDT